MGKKANGFKQKPESRKMAWVGILILLIGAGIVTASSLTKPEQAKNSSEEATLDYILKKLSPKPIDESLLPVVIFQYNDGGGDGKKKPEFYQSGSGTLLKLPDGTSGVVTAEHLFSVDKEINHTCNRYIVKILHEEGSPSMMSGGLVSAKPFFAEKPGVVDAAVCEFSKTRDERILPFSRYQPRTGKKEKTEMFYECEGKPEDLIIRSLVSGEEVRIFSSAEIPGVKEMRNYLIDYESRSGESGMGFVDRRGYVYILKGSVNDKEEVDWANKFYKDKGLIKQDRKGFSIVVGSFKFRTN